MCIDDIIKTHSGFRDFGLKTGIGYLDDSIRFAPGRMNLVTGIPSSGKSAFIDMLMICLSIIHCKKWVIFSPEHLVSEHTEKLIEIYLGKSVSPIDYNGNYLDKSMYATKKEIDNALEYINSHFTFVDSDEQSCTIEDILSAVKQCMDEEGDIMGYLLDPWNHVEHKKTAQESTTDYISRALSKIGRFTKKHHLIFFLVVHPKKMELDKNGKIKIPTAYDIADSAHWFNKLDNIITVHRQDKLQTLTEIHIQKVKSRHHGKLSVCELDWDFVSGRYKPTNFTKFGLPNPEKHRPNTVYNYNTLFMDEDPTTGKKYEIVDINLNLNFSPQP